MRNAAFDLVNWAKRELEYSDVPCAEKDAKVLFTHSFRTREEDIYAIDSFRPKPESLILFRHYIKLRASRFPLQYIIKNAEFMGLAFAIEKGIFIPRPETELLVEKVLEEIKIIGKKRIDILEIGTGCGNIAISLTKNAASCRIIASDISDKALKMAVGNARIHKVARKIKFIKSDYFDNISPIYYNYFDIIVSNPPYIETSELKCLQPEIAYEDIKALDGGRGGVYSYRRILSEGIRYLKKDGVFVLEIGYNQRKHLESLVENDGRLSGTRFYRDYNGYERILIVKKHRERK